MLVVHFNHSINNANAYNNRRKQLLVVKIIFTTYQYLIFHLYLSNVHVNLQVDVV